MRRKTNLLPRNARRERRGLYIATILILIIVVYAICHRSYFPLFFLLLLSLFVCVSISTFSAWHFHPFIWSYFSSVYCFPGVSTVSTSFFFIRLVFFFGIGPLNCPFLFVFTIPFCVCLLRALLYFLSNFPRNYTFSPSCHTLSKQFSIQCTIFWN